MMLGRIVDALTNTATAEEAIAAIASPEVLRRIEAIAASESVTTAAMVAFRVRHLIEHGGEDIWLDLIGVMSGSPQPGAAAVERILARCFPDPPPHLAKRTGDVTT